MDKEAAICLDSTVRSQDSSNSDESKISKESKSETSCLDSKHSKDVLIAERPQQKPQQDYHHHHHHRRCRKSKGPESISSPESTGNLMFASCGQLLLGVVLVVFGILVLVHGAALGNSGAGIWAGLGALVAGALGVVATLATSNEGEAASPSTSGFATAHLASSLVALALSNMAAITALTAVIRDSQRTPEFAFLGEEDEFGTSDGSWAGILASIGLLLTSAAELFISGYSCVTLTPRLCGCLRASNEDEPDEGRLKNRNMVQQWIFAQNHVPKNQPIYVVQPIPVHHVIQPPFGMHPAPPGKYPGGFLPGTLPMPAPGYGPVPILPHMAYPASRPPSQMMRGKPRRQQQQQQHVPSDGEDSASRRHHHHDAGKNESKGIIMTSIGEDQVDLAQTYTGLDKKMSEEFISIAMDPDRKSKASSHHGSEFGQSSSQQQ